jgi:general stress protein 26
MTDLDRTEEDYQYQLMEELSYARCVMLGSTDKDHHMQPMTPQVDEEAQIIYFFSDRFSELGKRIAMHPGEVELVHINKDYQASVKGRLSVHYDKETVDRFWSPTVEAWYPDGKEDTKLMMLKFIPKSATLWESGINPISFIYKIVKANLQNEEPDLGAMKTINL